MRGAYYAIAQQDPGYMKRGLSVQIARQSCPRGRLYPVMNWESVGGYLYADDDTATKVAQVLVLAVILSVSNLSVIPSMLPPKAAQHYAEDHQMAFIDPLMIPPLLQAKER